MASSEKTAAQRSRPRDRKQQIEKAAAEAFARSGYHPVSMQDIADTVGITATALYRHFPNKYALFAHTAFAFADRLLSATEEASSREVLSRQEARLVIEELIDAVAGEFVADRSINGIYRWEGRHLKGDDRAKLNRKLAVVGSRLTIPYAVYRPDVPEHERTIILIAAFSVLSSVTMHTTRIAKPRLRARLNELAWRLLDIDVGAYADGSVRRTPFPDWEAEEGPSAQGSPRREQLLQAGIKLFAEHGYNDATIEDLAAAVSLTPSGVYRHFAGKSELLTAAYDRASAWLDKAGEAARAQSQSPAEELRLLCGYYVDHSFRSADLMRVYFSEQGNLDPSDLKHFVQMQRDHVARWTALFHEVHPDLSARDAPVPLYAFFSIIGDQMTFLPEYDDFASSRLLAFSDVLLDMPVDDPVSAQ
ncbi:TetR family transcriptional regulator [Leucobacter komagatae]|uniref:TetR family transcriptional regulator n=1 Tax=Leucobacter komagatae TaxID=55969 RepID=A0A542Y987_9MICO|nr:TetR/AcrR family transcriptional regulator [Leucobacter komagatae]TQL44554.1 TetR family transcriptional regulator [Leucobacter komagatae]